MVATAHIFIIKDVKLSFLHVHIHTHTTQRARSHLSPLHPIQTSCTGFPHLLFVQKRKNKKASQTRMFVVEFCWSNTIQYQNKGLHK